LILTGAAPVSGNCKLNESAGGLAAGPRTVTVTAPGSDCLTVTVCIGAAKATFTKISALVHSATSALNAPDAPDALAAVLIRRYDTMPPLVIQEVIPLFRDRYFRSFA
jgi:hypothetical protein